MAEKKNSVLTNFVRQGVGNEVYDVGLDQAIVGEPAVQVAYSKSSKVLTPLTAVQKAPA